MPSYWVTGPPTLICEAVIPFRLTLHSSGLCTRKMLSLLSSSYIFQPWKE